MIFMYSVSVVLLALPLLASCVPWDFVDPGQQQLMATETLTSTLLASTPLTRTSVVGGVSAPSSEPDGPSSSGAASAVPASTSSSSAAQAILFFPPADWPSTSASAPSSALQPSSVATTSIPASSATPSITSTSTQAGPSPSSAPPVAPLIMAYYPDWVAPAFPPEKIDFGRFDWIDFAFAMPDDGCNLVWDNSQSADLLRRLVDAAHAAGTKVKLSVGGWSGSQYFSPAVSGADSRQALVNNILAIYTQFVLDGIDIDWEYPGRLGNEGNNVSPDDTANFLSFLQLLRKTLPPTAKISAAALTVPFTDATGHPLGDASAFAQVLDWVLLMNYDTWGSSNTPGPNAPLSDACHNSTQPAASAAAAVQAWTAAGFPASQLVLGVPSYGYVSQSSETRLRQRSAHARRRFRSGHRGPQPADALLARDDAGTGSDAETAPPIVATSEDGSAAEGQVQFRELVAQGVLQYLPQERNASTEDGGDADADVDGGGGAPTWVHADGQEIHALYDGWSGFVREWDACSSTPFLRSGAAGQVVTYDDPLSLGMKATFARGVGLLGVNMFDVSGDTDQWDLTDAVRKGLGVL